MVGKTAAYQRDLDQLTNSDFNNDHIVVYPQGINVGNSKGPERVQIPLGLLVLTARYLLLGEVARPLGPHNGRYLLHRGAARQASKRSVH